MPQEQPRDATEEMVQLYDWAVTIVRFIARVSKLPRELEWLYDRKLKSIDQALEDRSLRALRDVAKDAAEGAADLSPRHQRQLEELLISKFGTGLRDARKDTLKQIERILQRGRIENEDEFEVLTARVDEIYADESKRTELDTINKLLMAFENGRR